MENVRIAIRDSTDSHSVGFFDNEAGIKYNSADLNRFLAGSASILTLRYHSKDIDTIRTGCKLSFEYKDEKYWLNILEVKKKGFNVELTAFSTNLEANNEVIGPYKAQSGEKIVSYINRFDPEHAFTIGINEVADKSIKLEWTGKDTVLARLYSVANFFDAELEFVTELNNDYSLKRHVLNIYKKGNLGRVINSPVRVGKDLKPIDYEDSIKELRTAVYCKGKDGITIAGLKKKVYDDKGKLLYFTDGPYLRAPQAKDRYPSVGKNSPDGYILLTLDDTEHETKEALYGYMLGRIKDVSNPKLTFTAEGGFDTKIGDTRILIDDAHYEPELYVQARVIETEESMLTGKVNKTVFSNYERKYSQVSDDLRKRVKELAKEAMPYTLELATNNGAVFKNDTGNSLITPTLKKGAETVSEADFRWTINGTSQTSNTYTMFASQVNGAQLVTVEAVLNGQVVATAEITFTNVRDGQDGDQGPKGEDGAVNITCGFTQGFSDSFTAINAGTVSITALSDGWAKMKYVNTTSSVKRVEFWLPKPDGLTENQIYTFVQEFRNNRSSFGLASYHVQDNASAFWGNDSGRAQISVSDGVKRFQRMVYLNQNTLDRATRLVTVNINVPAGSTLDVETRMSCYVGSYSGPYIPYQGGKTGAKGQDAYFYVAYADSATGSGFSLTDTSKRYMGHYSSNSPTQSASASSYKWVDRANVPATFLQSVIPANPPAGARWKYTGSSNLTANGSAIKPGEQYLFIENRWVKDVITSDNLEIKNQFINGPMIKDGSITVDKLSVRILSAITANLGSVTAGKVLLQRSFGAGRSVVPAFNYPAHKTGIFMDNYGLIVNGTPVQKTPSEKMASDMPVAALMSGELRFLRVNLTDNLEAVLHNGLSDPDFGYIQFGVDNENRKALRIVANGQIYLSSENYTDWTTSTVNRNVKWKVQGNLVIVSYDVTFPTGGNKHIVTVPSKYVPSALMLSAKAWHTFADKDRNAQLNADGGLHILATDANQLYRGQIVWAY